MDWARVGESRVVSGGGDNALRVAAFEPNEAGLQPRVVLEHPQAHQGDINCVRWNPKVPGLLASCGDDGVVRIWRM